jgi:S1-C subfamily serine protease
VLTHDAALQGRSSLTLSAGGRRFEGRVVVYEAATGLALLETEPSGAPTVKVSELAPAAGMLTLGVGRTDDGDVAIPLFVTSVSPDRYTLGAVNGSIPPGLPVFNVAGELLAITVPEETETRAVPVKAAATRLLARVATGERRWALGLGLQPTADISAGGSGRGLAITDVLEGGPADEAGVHVGSQASSWPPSSSSRASAPC